MFCWKFGACLSLTQCKAFCLFVFTGKYKFMPSPLQVSCPSWEQTALSLLHKATRRDIGPVKSKMHTQLCTCALRALAAPVAVVRHHDRPRAASFQPAPCPVGILSNCLGCRREAGRVSFCCNEFPNHHCLSWSWGRWHRVSHHLVLAGHPRRLSHPWV